VKWSNLKSLNLPVTVNYLNHSAMVALQGTQQRVGVVFKMVSKAPIGLSGKGSGVGVGIRDPILDGRLYDSCKQT
jgi:hypothetical protein